MCINNNYIGSRLDAFTYSVAGSPLTLINPGIGMVSKAQLRVRKPNFLCMFDFYRSEDRSADPRIRISSGSWIRTAY